MEDIKWILCSKEPWTSFHLIDTWIAFRHYELGYFKRTSKFIKRYIINLINIISNKLSWRFNKSNKTNKLLTILNLKRKESEFFWRKSLHSWYKIIIIATPKWRNFIIISRPHLKIKINFNLCCGINSFMEGLNLIDFIVGYKTELKNC